MQPVRTPKRRECECCGRVEVWENESWRVAVNGDTRLIGAPYCIHEWDITGEFSPVATSETSH